MHRGDHSTMILVTRDDQSHGNFMTLAWDAAEVVGVEAELGGGGGGPGDRCW